MPAWIDLKATAATDARPNAPDVKIFLHGITYTLPSVLRLGVVSDEDLLEVELGEEQMKASVLCIRLKMLRALNQCSRSSHTHGYPVCPVYVRG